MIQIRRKNTAWLMALGLLLGFALLAGNIAPPVQLVLISLFAISMGASFLELGSNRASLVDAIKRAPLRQRVSPSAREAMDRARSRGGFTSENLMMLDVGLIAIQTSSEGMTMRRTRSVSKDDDGARPFVTLQVDPSEADRNALVRFEIIDHSGAMVYVHEMRSYLRQGEMNSMADHHLKLAGNDQIEGIGDWDLRVFLDGSLVGLHNFALTPSLRERQQRLSQAARQNHVEDERVFDEVEEEVPVSLQELLRDERSRAAAARRSSSRRS